LQQALIENSEVTLEVSVLDLAVVAMSLQGINRGASHERE